MRTPSHGTRRGSRGRHNHRPNAGGPDPVSDLELKLAGAYEAVLRHAGAWDDDPTLLDVRKTPQRVARMMARELLSGYRPGALDDLWERFTTFPVSGPQELLVQGPIPCASLCAHHLLPFVGEAWVGYVPNRKLAGLSKFTRVVRHFARKLQMQERLTTQVADFLVEALDPKGLIVFIEARHFCMELRGVEAAGVFTRTSALRGIAMKPAVKSEFLSLISRK